MKTPRRYQSQLLPRRSYKPPRWPRRRLGITFQPDRRVAVAIAQPPREAPPPRSEAEVIALAD